MGYPCRFGGHVASVPTASLCHRQRVNDSVFRKRRRAGPWWTQWSRGLSSRPGHLPPLNLPEGPFCLCGPEVKGTVTGLWRRAEAGGGNDRRRTVMTATGDRGRTTGLLPCRARASRPAEEGAEALRPGACQPRRFDGDLPRPGRRDRPPRNEARRRKYSGSPPLRRK